MVMENSIAVVTYQKIVNFWLKVMVMKQVRWFIEVSRKGEDHWVARPDLVYDGWFNSFGNDEPSQTVLDEFDRAVEEYPWLDIRLIRETREFNKTIIRSAMRT